MEISVSFSIIINRFNSVYTNILTIIFLMYTLHKKIIDDYLVGQYELSQELIFQIFQETKCFISDKISKIADEILNYKISSVGSELFYEVKTKEWLSIIINDYYSQQKEKKINPDDNQALDNVKHYINDHLTTTIPQDLLAKIAMMSKTKLKKSI